jgi:hypothetical protein
MKSFNYTLENIVGVQFYHITDSRKICIYTISKIINEDDMLVTWKGGDTIYKFNYGVNLINEGMWVLTSNIVPSNVSHLINDNYELI